MLFRSTGSQRSWQSWGGLWHARSSLALRGCRVCYAGRGGMGRGGSAGGGWGGWGCIGSSQVGWCWRASPSLAPGLGGRRPAQRQRALGGARQALSPRPPSLVVASLASPGFTQAPLSPLETPASIPGSLCQRGKGDGHWEARAVVGTGPRAHGSLCLPGHPQPLPGAILKQPQ